MANDSWRTPESVFNRLHSEFFFIADMAADDDNSLCENCYFTEEDDSLSFKWSENERIYTGYSNYVWCNPPYSDPMPWVLKAQEAQKDGLGTVMLLNNDPSVGWYAQALKTVSEVRHVIASEKENGKYKSGRLAFLNEDNKPISGNNRGQVIFVFDPFRIGTRYTQYVEIDNLMK